jgi:hypothetical protein
VYSHESMVVRHFAHVPQLHRWARLLDALREVFDRSAVPKDGINPFIFKAIRQLAKHRENVAETVRQGGVNVVLHGSSISQVQNVDIVTNLADPLHSAFALPTAFSTAPLATRSTSSLFRLRRALGIWQMLNQQWRHATALQFRTDFFSCLIDKPQNER